MCNASKLYLREISVNENMVRCRDESRADDIASGDILKVWFATRETSCYRSVLVKLTMDATGGRV
jgi:hypothetical protein